VLGSCARLGSPPSTTPPSATLPIPHPAGEALVFRIASGGGFVPADFIFSNLPGFTLVGDGRVIVTGPQVEIYPAPALPALNVRRLNDAGMQLVLREILDSGQFAADAAWLGANSFVADAPDTVFTLHADGREVEVRVYALGILDPEQGGDWPQISSEEREAHRDLHRLSDRLMSLDAWLPAAAWADPSWQPFTGDTIRLLVRSVDGESPNPDGLPFQELAWPSADDPEAFGEPVAWDEGSRCGVASGSEAAAWYAALAQANQLTRWTRGSHRYTVAVRPLLPDEAEACPSTI